MGRAWTLQEGALARECLLQLGDCVLNTKEMSRYAFSSPRYIDDFLGSSFWLSISWGWTHCTYYKQVCSEQKGNAGLSMSLRARIAVHYSFWIMAYILSIVMLPLTYIFMIVTRGSFHLDRKRDDRAEDVSAGQIMDNFLSDELRDSFRQSLRPPSFQDYLNGSSRSAIRFRSAWNALVGR